ncbi:uncharacterized protein LOC106704599 [Latimeria chalumnae]|uniref:uncharacterized protein LOC106704599 n=1 Tax=Latimeria chalumnae TaxID=7897 RepID=UPI0006D8E3A8|nr:PREDICTED: uncharacterized protein LOC106704599 [Latimeria chalumnae]|eukprot:XP_014347465.1 PREDICTED: uncharacterized protein LOC106704599 [Latimeria chalumnae]
MRFTEFLQKLFWICLQTAFTLTGLVANRITTPLKLWIQVEKPGGLQPAGDLNGHPGESSTASPQKDTGQANSTAWNGTFLVPQALLEGSMWLAQTARSWLCHIKNSLLRSESKLQITLVSLTAIATHWILRVLLIIIAMVPLVCTIWKTLLSKETLVSLRRLRSVTWLPYKFLHMQLSYLGWIGKHKVASMSICCRMLHSLRSLRRKILYKLLSLLPGYGCTWVADKLAAMERMLQFKTVPLFKNRIAPMIMAMASKASLVFHQLTFCSFCCLRVMHMLGEAVVCVTLACLQALLPQSWCARWMKAGSSPQTKMQKEKTVMFVDDAEPIFSPLGQGQEDPLVLSVDVSKICSLQGILDEQSFPVLWDVTEMATAQHWLMTSFYQGLGLLELIGRRRYAGTMLRASLMPAISRQVFIGVLPRDAYDAEEVHDSEQVATTSTGQAVAEDDGDPFRISDGGHFPFNHER